MISQSNEQMITWSSVWSCD